MGGVTLKKTENDRRERQVRAEKYNRRLQSAEIQVDGGYAMRLKEDIPYSMFFFNFPFIYQNV